MVSGALNFVLLFGEGIPDILRWLYSGITISQDNISRYIFNKSKGADSTLGFILPTMFSDALAPPRRSSTYSESNISIGRNIKLTEYYFHIKPPGYLSFRYDYEIWLFMFYFKALHCFVFWCHSFRCYGSAWDDGHDSLSSFPLWGKTFSHSGVMILLRSFSNTKCHPICLYICGLFFSRNA